MFQAERKHCDICIFKICPKFWSQYLVIILKLLLYINLLFSLQPLNGTYDVYLNLNENIHILNV